MSIYDPLFRWLRAQGANQINVSFLYLERILGFDLPESARIDAQWWHNAPEHVQAKAWLDAGFYTEQVDLTAETLTFAR